MNSNKRVYNGQRFERNMHTWEEEEIATLKKLYGNGVEPAEIAFIMKRTERAIRSRLGVLNILKTSSRRTHRPQEPILAAIQEEADERLNPKAPPSIVADLIPIRDSLNQPPPPPSHLVEIITLNGVTLDLTKLPIEAPKRTPDPDLNLLLWFVEEAWKEGHTITIPSLGATFKKEQPHV